ncbi:serine/arginine repetitive matrix protein 1-like [Mugil cephalus]|uniref:serine/arginine repetitive matrix protein 1-like n=1 Tax=Mugil cephalus TaxID=48193 RepID=UPI001FB841D7|nr:serine/arginine repetitive matrix protein 1-like [Mugil cephalus]
MDKQSSDLYLLAKMCEKANTLHDHHYSLSEIQVGPETTKIRVEQENRSRPTRDPPERSPSPELSSSDRHAKRKRRKHKHRRRDLEEEPAQKRPCVSAALPTEQRFSPEPSPPGLQTKRRRKHQKHRHRDPEERPRKRSRERSPQLPHKRSREESPSRSTSELHNKQRRRRQKRRQKRFRERSPQPSTSGLHTKWMAGWWEQGYTSSEPDDPPEKRPVGPTEWKPCPEPSAEVSNVGFHHHFILLLGRTVLSCPTVLYQFRGCS